MRDSDVSPHYLTKGRPGSKWSLPAGVHSKKRYVNRFGKKEMRQRGLMICKQCHAGIRDLMPNEKELADKYHTKELLLANEAIRMHIAWVRKQK